MNDLKNKKSLSTHESEKLNRKALQALPFHVAVIDREGCILTVNDAWTNFALNNDAGGSPSVNVGANYCDTCRRAVVGNDIGAVQALGGIEAVLSGELEQFSMEYPCHSPQQQRWFLMTVVPLDRGGSGAVITHFDISSRKETEESLKAGENRLRLALAAARMASWDWHVPSGDVNWNDMLYRMLGYEPGEVQPSYQAWASRVHPDDLAAVESELHHCMAEHRIYTAEFRSIRPNGGLRWLEVHGDFEYDDNGQPIHNYGVVIDVTERKMAEQSLKESEALYRSIGESIDYGVWVCTPDGRNTYASESFLKMVGITQEQCSNFGWGDVLHPDDAARTIAAWQECVRTGGIWDIEHRFRSVDGQWRHVLARGVPVRNEQGEIVCWAGINLDISRLKQAEELLDRHLAVLDGINGVLAAALTRQSEEELGVACLEIAQKITQSRFGFIGTIKEDRLVDIAITNPGWDVCTIANGSGHSPPLASFKIHGIYGRVLTDGKALFSNDPAHHPDRIGLPAGHPALEAFLGVPLIHEGRTTGLIAVANRPGGYTAAEQEALETLAPAIVEAFMRKRAEDALRKAHDELEQRVQERTVELETVVDILKVEIAERKKAEKELEASARKIEDLYNFAPCGYHSLDKDGTIVRINATELGWLGYEREEVVGKMKAAELLTAESQTVFANNFSRLTSGNDLYDLRLSFIRKDGSILPVLLSATPIMDDNGDYLMSRSTIYDITDLVQAEESIRRLNLLYLTLSETGKVIAHSSDRDQLFQEICRIIVEYGGFRMAWIGLVDQASGLVVPTAAFGDGMDFLDNIRVSVLQEPEGMGPTGTAIREGGSYICNTFLADPRTAPWQQKAEQRGFLASASLAIKLHGTTIGAVTMYASSENYFDPQIVELLMQMQEDIAFALDSLDREEQRLRMEQALRDETLERLRVVESLREQEQMLIQQSRQAAMGEMIGNIAHQWRQPLNTLGLFTQRLGFFYGSPSFTKEFLDTSVAKSMEIIQYMSRTIDDFRSFFSIDREKSDFRVDEAVDKVLSLVEASFSECRIHLEREEKRGIIINGFPNEYAQVLLNIFINAKDAIIERQVESPRVKVTIDTENGTSVVTIADNAGGISEKILDKIFDPYFTTKGPQQGTGVGLFMSKTIIENKMGGRLTVRNTDLGAEFRIEV